MPAPKDVPYSFVFSIIILAVSGQNVLHYVAHSARLPFHQKVNVVRHQAVRITVKPRSFPLFCKQRQKLQMVFGKMKHVPPVIAPHDNVIKPSLNLNSPLPRHTREII